MAKKKKGGKKTTKKTKKSKKKNNGFAKIIAVILVLALISMLIAYGITSWNAKPQKQVTKPKAEQTTVTKPVQKAEKKQPAKVELGPKESKPKIEELPAPKKSAIEGTWLSSLNGTMLTISDDSYTIDFMSVDAQDPMSGKFSINGETISFFDEKSRCQDIRGEYRFSQFNDSTLVIELIQDDCPKREASLDSDWKRI